MVVSDQMFDVLMILLFLATPLFWAGALFFQDLSRSPVRSSK